VLRGRQKLSFDVPVILARDRIEQLADLADPTKSHIGPLGIFGLNFDAELHSLLPDARVGTGVIVVGMAPGFDSVNTGLRAGDVIHAINRTPVTSVEQLRAALGQLKAGDSTVLQIEREGQFQYLAFEME